MADKYRVRISHGLTDRLTSEQLDELWTLYAPHHNFTREAFEDRLKKGMTYVTRYRDFTSGILVGMTAIRVEKTILTSGIKVHTVYSGMSYIEPPYRGLRLLPRTLGHYGTKLKLRHPFGNVYLWSDAISYKPYVVSARSTKELYPSRKGETPAHIREFIQWVGKRYYGDAFDPETGTVRKTSNRLKDHVAPITEKELEDPDIRFYAENNPFYQRGDGLINVIPLSWENLSTSFFKALTKRWKKRKSKPAATMISPQHAAHS